MLPGNWTSQEEAKCPFHCPISKWFRWQQISWDIFVSVLIVETVTFVDCNDSRENYKRWSLWSEHFLLRSLDHRHVEVQYFGTVFLFFLLSNPILSNELYSLLLLFLLSAVSKVILKMFLHLIRIMIRLLHRLYLYIKTDIWWWDCRRSITRASADRCATEICGYSRY